MDVAAIEPRFWSKVLKGEPDECWIWTGAIGKHGYGVIGTGDGKGTITSHRLAYTLAHGSIPEAHGSHGGVVMHTCDNRRCCNPAHLVVGSQADNLRDMRLKGREGKPDRRGCRNSQSRLTENQIKEIRSLNGKMTQKAIAQKFGTTQATISSILLQRSWKHV